MPPLVPQQRESALPLSFAQERLWFLDQLGLVGSAYNAQMALRMEGTLDVGALERSLAEVVRRHETLRTRFESISGSPIQIIDAPKPFALEVMDLSCLQQGDRALHIQERSNEDAQRPFNLSKGPLLRTSLLKFDRQEHALLLTIHHIATDGWSWGILHRELAALYSAYVRDRPSPLPELAVQYADYAVWQRQWLQGEVLQEQLQYWRQRLLGAPPQLELPTDRSRPAKESFRGASLSLKLSAWLSRALKDLA